MFPEGPEAAAHDRDASELAAFLREFAQPAGRRAAALITGGLPLFGTGARKRLRQQLTDQLLELARHLDSFGEEGPRLYGESQRRYAAARLAEGVALHEALEERAVTYDVVLQFWGENIGPVPGRLARLLAQSFAEVTSQAAEVWLTFQRAESVAFQEAALLDTIVHHLDEAILVVEPEGTISYATPALESIIGMPPRFFVGVKSDRLASIAERLDLRDKQGNPIPRDELPHSRALRTRQVQHLEFVRLRRLDGTEAVCELYATPVFEEEGQLRGAVVTLRDRTHTFEQTQALEDAYNELRVMHARLLSRSRLEATGELAGSAAHALNNQLNVITLRLRRLMDHAGATEDATAIERSVREIATVVARLQEFAAAPQPDRPVALDATGVVGSALELVRAELGPATDVHVKAELAATRAVLAERETLLEFLTALLLGARDATPTGGAVEVATAEEGDRVVIRVSERGPTLTSEQVNQLFEPMAAGAAARALSFSLGRQAVQRWGGEVRVLPRPGGGNVYEVFLRRYEGAVEAEAEVVREAPPPRAAPEPKPQQPAAAPAQVRSVLVVDDDADNAAMLADLIRDSEVEAHTAGTGAQAIEVAERTHPDVALVDLLLPDMKGWDVVDKIKERWPETRVAVVSGLAVGRDDPDRGKADAVFRKPIDTEELLGFIGL